MFEVDCPKKSTKVTKMDRKRNTYAKDAVDIKDNIDRLITGHFSYVGHVF